MIRRLYAGGLSFVGLAMVAVGLTTISGPASLTAQAAPRAPVEVEVVTFPTTTTPTTTPPVVVADVGPSAPPPVEVPVEVPVFIETPVETPSETRPANPNAEVCLRFSALHGCITAP